MGSVISIMKLTTLATLPGLLFAKNIKLQYKLEKDDIQDMLLGGGEAGDNYYIQGDMVVNHGTINQGNGGRGGEEVDVKFGRWFAKCFMNDSQKSSLYNREKEMKEKYEKHESNHEFDHEFDHEFEKPGNRSYETMRP